MMMMMMEESDCVFDVLGDIDLSPGRMIGSSFFSDSCFARQDLRDAFRGGGDVGIEINDVNGGVEDSKMGVIERRTTLVVEEEYNNGIGVAGDFGGVKSTSSIAERRASKCGFNASKISTPRFRSCSSLSSPGVRSPYLTIPAGISPAMLLDSPIMVPNSHPSPTTGSFAVSEAGMDSAMVDSASYGLSGNKCHDCDTSFRFNPETRAIPLACSSALRNQVFTATDSAPSLGDEIGSNAVVSAESQADFGFVAPFHGAANPKKFDGQSPVDVKVPIDVAVDADSTMQIINPSTVSGCEMSPDDEASRGEVATEGHYMDLEHKGIFSLVGSLRTSDDGYNWRKYGQKQVKGSEYPRSYYKCTHLNCPVKKKIERSHDGQITEIIYKGSHNHPKPQLNRRATFGSMVSVSDSSEVAEGSVSCVKLDDGGAGRSTHYSSRDMKVGPDGLERTPSTSGVTEVSDPMSTTQGNLVGMPEAAGTLELSSPLAIRNDDEEDPGTEGSMPLGDDDEDESDSKRRKKEESSMVESFYGTTMNSRSLREPRVVVQIESEIDILDDGYRWRKYGQKVVKGNPNPRSYYKCTSTGCTVRKHVERASHNLKYVITTYEGKHNHEVPVAKNSSHASPSGGNLTPAAPNTQAALALPRNSHLPKPEYLGTEIDPNLGYHYDVPRTNYLGNFGAGSSSFYPMKFPSLPSAAPYGSFGINSSDCHPYASSIAPAAVPELSIPLPFGIPGPSNFSVTNYSNRDRLFPVPNFFKGTGLLDGGMKLMRPKLELRDDSSYDLGLPNQISTSSASSLYHHIHGHFPS